MQEADWHMEVQGGGPSSTSPFLDCSVTHTPGSFLGKEKEGSYPMLSVQKNEETTIEGKREMRTALFPRSSHIYVNQILRDIWGGSTLTT